MRKPSQDVLDAAARGDGRVGLEAQLRRSLQTHLVRDGGLQPDAGGPERGLLVLMQRGKEDQGVPQVRIAIHTRDGQQAEPGVSVGQPLQRIRQHFAQDLVDPADRG